MRFSVIYNGTKKNKRKRIKIIKKEYQFLYIKSKMIAIRVEIEFSIMNHQILCGILTLSYPKKKSLLELR